jgi:hypothetical protein
MIARELSKLTTTSRDLRKFGLVVGGVFALLAAWLIWRGRLGAAYLLVPGLLLVVLGGACPRALKWPYLAWMSLGIVLGAVVSTVLLTVFYYLVVTPVGLLARLAGKDFMARRRSPDATSYWVVRGPAGPKKPAQYERQF